MKKSFTLLLLLLFCVVTQLAFSKSPSNNPYQLLERYHQKSLFYEPSLLISPKVFKPLQPIAWKKVQAKAPTIIPVSAWTYAKALKWQNGRAWDPHNSPLPLADYVVIIRVNAEWASLDHVFMHSQEQQPYTSATIKDTGQWRPKGWVNYARNVTPYWKLVKRWDANTPFVLNKAFAAIAMVAIHQKRVLLVKPFVQLPFDGPSVPVFHFVRELIQQSQPKLILTSGTSGGTTVDMHLGAVVITPCTQFQIRKVLAYASYANKIYCSQPTHLKLNLQSRVYPLWQLPPFDAKFGNVIIKSLNTFNRNMSQKMHKKLMSDYQLSDFMNATLVKENFKRPQIISTRRPNQTAVAFTVSRINGNTAMFANLQSNDAVEGLLCNQFHIPFLSVRDISDSSSNVATHTGMIIATEDIQKWQSLLYNVNGMYTSVNSALVDWAIIWNNT